MTDEQILAELTTGRSEVSPEVTAEIDSLTSAEPTNEEIIAEINAKAAKVKKAVKKAAKPKVKKATKKTAKKIEPATTPIEVPVKKSEVLAPKAAKIDPKELVGNNFEIKIMGTCTKFIGSDRHGYLKGCTLEISNLVDSLKDRMEVISKEHAEKYHLGKSKAFIKKLSSTADLQSVLDLYFKA